MGMIFVMIVSSVAGYIGWWIGDFFGFAAGLQFDRQRDRILVWGQVEPGILRLRARRSQAKRSSMGRPLSATVKGRFSGEKTACSSGSPNA